MTTSITNIRFNIFMRICFAIDTLGPGGAERVVTLLANKFAMKGHVVFLAAFALEKLESFYKVNDKVCFIPLAQNKRNKLKKIVFFRNFLKDNKIDIVVSFLPQINIYSFLATSFSKTIHIPSLRSNPESDVKGQIRRFFRWLSFMTSDGCVFQTRDALTFFGNRIAKKSTVIHNPLNNSIQFFEGDVFDNRIVSVGRFSIEKNKKSLILAFELFSHSHPSYSLVLYGDGYQIEEMKELCKELNLGNKVLFLGNDPDWYKKEIHSRMFVLSSNYEGMPNALMEAMATGIPCVSTDCPIGGPKELIVDGVNGLLVPVGDVSLLSIAMARIADDRALALRLKNQNRNMIKDYSTDVICDEWELFLSSKVNKKR